MHKRPLAVTIVASLMLAAGVAGFAYHFSELNLRHPLQNDALLIEAIRIVAVVCGVFLLRGQDWARWLTMAWLTLHVVVSAFDSMPKLAFHIVLTVVLGYLLFRETSGRYFRNSKDGVSGA